MATYETEWNDEESQTSGSDYHRILECMGCKTVYFQIESYFSEDYDFRRNPVTGEEESFIRPTVSYWPALSKRDEPAWMIELANIDLDLHSLLYQVYVAVNNDLHVLAAIGIRTVFDRASELLGIDPDLSFAAKLDALLREGKIGKDERGYIEVLTDAGSAAAHRGWRPNIRELDTLLTTAEGFINRAFIVAKKAELLKKAIPPRAR